jgi:vanillate O-demethylase monooxygenase subunit
LSIDNLSPALSPWWHPVAIADQVGDEPLRARLLGRAWALVRWADGHISAYEDRCPHRGVRLSAGHLVDCDGQQALQCIYHGWKFGPDGSCVDVPSLRSGDDTRAVAPSGPRFAAVPAAGVQERYGIVWLAPEPPRAPLLAFEEWDEPGFEVRFLATRRMKTGAAQLIENNFDFAHIPFVHTGTFGLETVLPRPEDVTVHRDGWSITSEHVSYLQGGRWQKDDTALHRSWLTAPFTSRLRVDLPDGRVSAWYQSVQPEDLDSSVVYQFIAVNDTESDEELKAEIEFNERILDEDMAVLELIDAPALDLHPDAVAHVLADRASTTYRRLLRDLVAPR